MSTQRWQTTAALGLGMLSLPVLSPYYQRLIRGRGTTGRNIHLFLNNMDFFIDGKGVAGGNPYIITSWFDSTPTLQGSTIISMLFSDVKTNGEAATMTAAINTYAAANSLTVSSILGLPTVVNAPVESALSLSVQTSTGAVGTQVSSTRNAYVMVNTGISTTATIGGASTGDLVLEVAPTNSATAGDWVEKSRSSNSQTITLAIVLQSVQVVKGEMIAYVPAGYYVKVRSITGAGSPTYSITSARQVLV